MCRYLEGTYVVWECKARSGLKKENKNPILNHAIWFLQGDRSLMVQWMDVNQLSQQENLHSKCLCVNRLPLDLCDSEELTQLFSETYKPVFCQVSMYFYTDIQIL